MGKTEHAQTYPEWSNIYFGISGQQQLLKRYSNGVIGQYKEGWTKGVTYADKQYKRSAFGEPCVHCKLLSFTAGNKEHLAAPNSDSWWSFLDSKEKFFSELIWSFFQLRSKELLRQG